MLDEITVDDTVWDLRPDFTVLVMVARDLTGGASDVGSRESLARAAAGAVDPGTDPHVESWRDAYRRFGAKPKRTRPSVEALLRRAPDGLPEINRIVDVYNAVSVRHVLPIGGEDLSGYRGPARLTRAGGDEPFDTVADGVDTIEYPEIGEVVWRDDAGATCRRWNWRQGVRTRLTERTRDALFILERLAPMTRDELRAAGDELAGLLAAACPVARIASRLIGPRDPGAA